MTCLPSSAAFVSAVNPEVSSSSYFSYFSNFSSFCFSSVFSCSAMTCSPVSSTTVSSSSEFSCWDVPCLPSSAVFVPAANPLVSAGTAFLFHVSQKATLLSPHHFSLILLTSPHFSSLHLIPPNFGFTSHRRHFPHPLPYHTCFVCFNRQEG